MDGSELGGLYFPECLLTVRFWEVQSQREVPHVLKQVQETTLQSLGMDAVQEILLSLLAVNGGSH